MKTKTYVTLEALDATAPIYQTTQGGQRSRITKRPFYRPYLQITYTGVDGKNKTIRYKKVSNTIYQDEQIKDGIPANERFTQSERDELYFRHGILTTTLPLAQTFLDNHPENENFKGQCEVRKAFKELDKAVEDKITNAELKKRAKAANKIFNLSLSEAQELLIRINGSYFKTPSPEDYEGTNEEKEESALALCQNMLVDFLDDTNEAGIDEILKENKELNIDEQNTVLIGKLINKGLLSFSQTEGKISKKGKDGSWIEVRDMSDQYTMDEKKRLFSDFLNTKDGKDLKNDLENDLAESEAKQGTKQDKPKNDKEKPKA